MMIVYTSRGLGPFTPIIRMYDDSNKHDFMVGAAQPTEIEAEQIAKAIYEQCRHQLLEFLAKTEVSS